MNSLVDKMLAVTKRDNGMMGELVDLHVCREANTLCNKMLSICYTMIGFIQFLNITILYIIMIISLLF